MTWCYNHVIRGNNRRSPSVFNVDEGKDRYDIQFFN